jgi:hypothetical protein
MQKDNTLQHLLEKKETPEPSDSLDDQIMAIISKSVQQTTTNRKSLNLEWFFFLLGLVSGIIISTIFVNTDTVILGLNLSDNGLIIQILCASIILLLFERLYKQSADKRNKQFSVKLD